jgi:hypothetical protein
MVSYFKITETLKTQNMDCILLHFIYTFDTLVCVIAICLKQIYCTGFIAVQITEK